MAPRRTRGMVRRPEQKRVEEGADLLAREQACAFDRHDLDVLSVRVDEQNDVEVCCQGSRRCVRTSRKRHALLVRDTIQVETRWHDHFASRTSASSSPSA